MPSRRSCAPRPISSAAVTTPAETFLAASDTPRFSSDALAEQARQERRLLASFLVIVARHSPDAASFATLADSVVPDHMRFSPTGQERLSRLGLEALWQRLLDTDEPDEVPEPSMTPEQAMERAWEAMKPGLTDRILALWRDALVAASLVCLEMGGEISANTIAGYVPEEYESLTGDVMKRLRPLMVVTGDEPAVVRSRKGSRVRTWKLKARA